MTEPSSRRRQRDEYEALLAHLRRQFQERLDAGLVPYEGAWVERDELARRVEQRRRRAGQVFVELLALNGVLALLGLALLFLAWAISA